MKMTQPGFGIEDEVQRKKPKDIGVGEGEYYFPVERVENGTAKKMMEYTKKKGDIKHGGLGRKFEGIKERTAKMKGLMNKKIAGFSLPAIGVILVVLYAIYKVIE